MNALICNIEETQDSNLPTAANYSTVSNMNLDTLVGVSLSGASLLNAIDLDGVDPFFPAVYGSVTNISNEKEGYDECLGHPNPQYLYHYHFMPPCVANPNQYLVTG